MTMMLMAVTEAPGQDQASHVLSHPCSVNPVMPVNSDQETLLNRG